MTEDRQMVVVQESKSSCGEQNNLMLSLFAAAQNNGVDADKLVVLEGVYTRHIEREQKQAYVRAMIEVAKELPIVLKNKVNAHSNYAYADFKSLCDTVKPVLSKHGLMLNYTSAPHDGGKILVTCILTHKDGHSVTSAMVGDPGSGTKIQTGIQATGAAMTYLQKYTLINILSLATGNEEDVDADLQRKADAGIPLMTEGQFKSFELRCQDFKSADEMRSLYAEVIAFKSSNNKAKIDALSAIYSRRRKELGL